MNQRIGKAKFQKDIYVLKNNFFEIIEKVFENILDNAIIEVFTYSLTLLSF